MKRLLFLFVALIAINAAFSQTPLQFKYQAVLRDASANIIANQAKTIVIDILQGNATGTSIFTETHNVTTTAQGIINLNIGSINTTGLGSIDWAANTYFIKITAGGVEMGTSQLLSVPYALYAKTANYNNLTNRPDYTKWDKDSTDNVTLTGNQTIAGNKTFSSTIIATNGLNANYNNITNVAYPINSTDAVTKSYVDDLIDNLYAQGSIRVRDNDGNYYNTLKIGNQIWMTENLKTTHYRNGDSIGTTYPFNKDISTETNPKYYWAYGGNGSNVATYGRLYTWYAMMDSRGVCPAGWHIPILEEWGMLINYFGGTSVAGGKLKETGTQHWLSPNTGATNESGFTALPGGWRSITGSFGQITNYVYFWVNMDFTTTSVYLYISAASASIPSSEINKGSGFSVRCVKD